ncbi:MAG: VWA domain-containing protein [Candidatus Zixiibacteriota bacterium]
MRTKNVTAVLVCLLLITLTFFVGCGEEKPGKGVSKGRAGASPGPTEAKAQPNYDQIQRAEIPLDDPDGEASLARNFYFIFDGSGSMGDTQAGQVKLKGAKEAVRKFLTKIPADANLGLYVFDAGGIREVVPLGSDNRDAFMQAIDAVKDGGVTPLAESIRFGTDRLVEQYKKQLGYGEYRLIVVTDGKASGIPGAAQHAARYSMPIYAIGLFIEGDHPLRTYALSYREANDYEDLERALEETLAELPSFDLTEFEEVRSD